MSPQRTIDNEIAPRDKNKEAAKWATQEHSSTPRAVKSNRPVMTLCFPFSPFHRRTSVAVTLFPTTSVAGCETSGYLVTGLRGTILDRGHRTVLHTGSLDFEQTNSLNELSECLPWEGDSIYV